MTDINAYQAEQRGVWFNRAWLQFVGTTLEYALATPWTTWAHPDDYTAIAAAYAGFSPSVSSVPLTEMRSPVASGSP